MIALNVSFGIYAFMPQGWIFMAVIILIECLGFSKLLTNTWKNSKIYSTILISNIISGIIGIIGSMMLNGGWWLVVWFPWVSSHEVRGDKAIKYLIIFYLIAFVLTILIESIINIARLQKMYAHKEIFFKTLIINIVSYLVGSLAMYSFTF